jgi:OOP family OmpA-OmpF porin
MLKLASRSIRIVFVIVFVFSAYLSFAQNYNKWSADANIGFNSALGPFTEGYQSNYLGLYHADANVRYMLSNKFGVMWGMGFDRIKNDELGHYNGEDNYFKTHYIRTSLQAVFNVGRMADFHELHDRVGLLLHGGFGFSSLKDAHRSVWFEDWRTQGTDEMMHLLIGFTPQVRLTDYLAIHADFTYVGNIWQTKTFDFTSPNEFRKGIDGRIVSFSVGASYYFGSAGFGKKHLDWVYDEGGSGGVPGLQPGDTLIQRETIRTIETIRVVDGDTTLIEGKVDKKPQGYGPNEDFDGDGVPNGKDDCPTTPGGDPNGCPNADKDGDGIVNNLDDCPDIPGILENGGCPGIDLAVKRILNEAMRTVKFELNNDDLIETSFEHIDKVVQVLNDHPEYKMHIGGHTDNEGQPGPLLSLSKARAKKVVEYMVSKGISADRLTSEGYGDTKPIAYNDNPSGREQNMRIEFTIKFQ